MDLDNLLQSDFVSDCENYQFTCDELKQYSEMEKALMHFYLEKKRSEGDNREKNQIYIEWIKIYSEEFRLMYMILRQGRLQGAI